MNPGFPEIDANGFRNPEPLSRAFLVALGDSHTYGYNVRSEEAWPQQLGRMLGETVYNFGIGGYGILSYHTLMEQALSLQPRHVVVGLYLPNDIAGICPELEAPYANRRLHADPDAARITASCQRLMGKSLPASRKDSLANDARTALLGSALGSAVSHLVWKPLKTRLQLAGFLVDEKRYLRVQDPRNPGLVALGRLESHIAYMDLSGEDVSLLTSYAERHLVEMADLARSRGSALEILLIPSRERVMHGYLSRHGHPLPEVYHRLVEVESSLATHLQRFLREAGIPSVDLVPWLDKALEESGGVYPPREDGHPLVAGQHAYAEGAFEGLFHSSRHPR